MDVIPAEFKVVVTYEFDTGPPEALELYRGTEQSCHRLEAKIEKRGGGLINYPGALAGRQVLQAFMEVVEDT